VPRIRQDVEKHSGAPRIDINVALDLVHALADPYDGGLVRHYVRSSDARCEFVPIPYVSFDKLRLGIEVSWDLSAWMYLGVEAIVGNDVMSILDQRVCDRGADKACRARDEYVFSQTIPPLLHAPRLGGAEGA
jgi:hypothetical protein